jgi:hypothetical protein
MVPWSGGLLTRSPSRGWGDVPTPGLECRVRSCSSILLVVLGHLPFFSCGTPPATLPLRRLLVLSSRALRYERSPQMTLSTHLYPPRPTPLACLFSTRHDLHPPASPSPPHPLSSSHAFRIPAHTRRLAPPPLRTLVLPPVHTHTHTHTHTYDTIRPRPVPCLSDPRRRIKGRGLRARAWRGASRGVSAPPPCRATPVTPQAHA